MKTNTNKLTDVLAVVLFAAAGFLLTQSVVVAWQAPSPKGQYTTEAATSTSASLNWSGYVAQGDSYTSVTGTWTIPRVSSANTTQVAADATWVGIGGVSEVNLIQAGTQAILDGQGNIVYQPWLETIPGDSYVIPITVSPGDSITTTITQEPDKTKWLISLRDNTTNKSYETIITHNSQLSSAEWIEEMPSSAYGNFFIPLDQFGIVPFTGGSTVDNGTLKTIQSSGAKPLTMTSLMGDQLATTSILSQDGGGFSVTRTEAQAQMAVSNNRRHYRTYTYYFSPESR